MTSHHVSYPHGQPFSWRWLADALADSPVNPPAVDSNPKT
jgi:hypothetical protein